MNTISLAQALRLSTSSRMALVGAGGKSSALFQAARDLLSPTTSQPITNRSAPCANSLSLPVRSVLLTCSTHLTMQQLTLADHSLQVQQKQDLREINKLLPPGVVLLTGTPTRSQAHPNRVRGLPSRLLESILHIADVHHVPLLIEADGARGMAFKAPAKHEPAIPPFATQVVVVAGLSGLGKPCSSRWVHRPRLFAALCGLSFHEPITVSALARVLTHPMGGLKNIPAAARRVLLLNQADTETLQAQAMQLARLVSASFHAVVMASLRANDNGFQSQSAADSMHPTACIYAVREQVAGIILAAGAATRFGTPKQLLNWEGEPLVRRAARQALQAGLSPVIVVGGHSFAQVQSALQDLDVQLVHNPQWDHGQSTSVRTGLQSLPAETGAAIFLLADQPFVTSPLLQSLVESHSQTLAAIIAPQVDGQRANPVLFDRVTFDDLRALTGDTGGRAIFSRYPVTWLPWHDACILTDIDTPEDYQRHLAMDE